MLSQVEPFLRSCSYCGLSFGRADIYCKQCWKALFWNYKVPLVETELPIQVRTLFSWKRRDPHPRIEHLVRTLKIARFIEGYLPLACELCYQFSYIKNVCFVP